jgi:hypothetical protein
MLETIKSGLKTALLILGCSVFFALLVLFIDLDHAVKNVDETVSQVRVTNVHAGELLQSATSSLNTATASLNGNVTALREHADRVLTEAGLTTMEARKQSAFWNQQAPELAAKLNAGVEHLDGLVIQSKSTLEIADDDFRLAQPLLRSGTKLLDDTDHVVANPDIALTLANFGKVTTSASLVADDGQKRFHLILNPPKKGKFMNTIVNTGRVAKWLLETRYYGTN